MNDPRCSIGFSGVIIALQITYLFYARGGLTNSLTDIQWVLIQILPQFMIAGISFEGHLSGFISGLATVLALNTFT